MATLDTTDDLLRAARENPEFLEASRRDVLIEELLVLPERFAAYATTTDKRLDWHRGRLGRSQRYQHGDETRGQGAGEDCERLLYEKNANRATRRAQSGVREI